MSIKYVAVILITLIVLSDSRSPAQPPATQPAEEYLTFTFPENTELKVLISYVGERLGLQFYYDDTVGQQRFTIKQGARIPRKTLLSFFELILQSKGFTLADMNQPGWKRIVAFTLMANAARPTTGPIDAGAVTEIFALQVVDASRMEALLRPFLLPGGTIFGVPEQRLLLITDYASNITRIRELVRMLDRSTREITVEFITLEHGDAQELSAKIAQVMQGTINTQGAPNPAQIGMVEVGFDQRTNQIVLIGARDRVAEAKRITKSFDLVTPLVTKTYQFDFASPERVDKLMRQMLDPAVAKRSYQSGVDKESRLLVVSGTPDIHQQIESLKKSLDVAIAMTDSPIQFYKLSNAKAEDVLDTIKGIQGEQIDRSQDPFRSDLSRERNSSFGRRQGGLYDSTESTADQASTRRRGFGRNSPVMSGATTQPGASASRESFQAPNATVTSDHNTNSIIVVAEPAVQKVYEQLIRTLDKRRPQVLVECTIVTLDTSRNFHLGVDIGINGGGGSSQFITFSSFGVSQPQTVGGAGTAATGRLALVPGAAGFNGALISPDIADVVVNALVTSGRAKVMSAPRILVNDNETGHLESNSEQPITSINVGNTVSTTSFSDYAKAGTTINLTPHISEANYLQLEYGVELSNFSGAGANGIPPPRQTSKLESFVTIPDGSTIIIGGLNSTNQSKTVSAIPILGQIPVLEYLFSSRSEVDSQSTLFVFIRPVVLRDDQFQDLKYLSERDSRSAGISPDEPISEPLIVQ